MIEYDWISVGVDGSEGSEAAAQWAAREAQRTGKGLRIVHVFNDFVPMAGLYTAVRPLGSMDGRPLAERVAREVAHHVEPLTDGRVEPIVLRGDRRAGLLHAASDSALMVLGDESHPVHHRVLTGSIIGSIAGHAASPVVVVPANCAAQPARDVVVIGVKLVATAHDVVRQGFELAADRRARLVVLHAWEHTTPYRGVGESQIDVAGWEERSTKELHQIVDEVARDFTNVEVEVRFVRAQPAQALAEASAEADLLAITRRLHGFPLGHLGATGRAVLRETRCPTIVLPPALETVTLGPDPRE